MGLLLINFEDETAAADLTAKLQKADAKEAAITLGNYFHGAAGGTGSPAKFTMNTGGARASGTFTFASVIATDVFTLDGVAFTCVSSGATGNQFNVGGSDTETAANAVNAINANTTLNKYLSASSALGVITVRAKFPGTVGNTYTLATSDATITVSGATMTGGTNGTEGQYQLGEAWVNGVRAAGTFTFASVIATDAFQINGITFTCVASGATGNQFNIGGSDALTAASAVAVINANTTLNLLVEASSSGAVLTVRAKDPGPLGNTYTIASLDATITASGATLANGSFGI